MKYKIKLKKKKPALHTNTSIKAKVDVRKHVLDLLENKNPKILDVFCARGEMWKEAYDHTPNYIGVDKDMYLDDRITIVAENSRYLRQADLDEFDVFDLDAYGSPFEQLSIICNRLTWNKKKQVGIILTDGTGMNSNLNAMNRTFLKWIGMCVHQKSRVQLTYRDSMILMGINKSAKEARAVVENVLVARKDSLGARMRYIGYLLTKA